MSFNFWMTPRMMFIAERTSAEVRGSGEARVDINTLGFAGTLAVKNEASLEMVKQMTPVQLLRAVAAVKNRVHL